jgi:hypothetical protein
MIAATLFNDAVELYLDDAGIDDLVRELSVVRSFGAIWSVD